MQKRRGRPPAKIATEQIALRLPVLMLGELRGSPLGLSGAIRDRLARSILQDQADPQMIKLAGQIEQIAAIVRRTFGSDWHTDKKAQLAFVDAVTRLLKGLPLPSKNTSDISAEPDQVGQIIYSQYMASVRDAEAGSTEFRKTVQQRLKDIGHGKTTRTR